MEKKVKIDEAVKRMKLLKLDEKTIKLFKNNQEYKISIAGVSGFLPDKYKKMISKFEQDFSCLVYHVIYTTTPYGELLSCLHVSKYMEEWEDEVYQIKKSIPDVYVINLTNDIHSEFGTIQVSNKNGYLERIE